MVEGGKISPIDCARQLRALRAQEFFHRARSEHQPPLAVENEHRVLQVLQQPVDIAAQVGDFVLRAAQPLAQQAHLGGHHARARRVAGFAAGGLVRLVFAAGHQIELVPQDAQRPERERRKQKGDGDSAPITASNATLALCFSAGMMSSRIRPGAMITRTVQSRQRGRYASAIGSSW